MINICEDKNNEQIKLFGISIPGSKLIVYNNEIVGMIDYNVYDERIHIQYITVNEPYRKLGIAKRIIEDIAKDNPGKYIYGDSLPGAIKFWEKLGAQFDEDDNDDYLTPFHICC